VSFFRYGQNHKDAAYNSINGRPLAATTLREYLFQSGPIVGREAATMGRGGSSGAPSAKTVGSLRESK